MAVPKKQRSKNLVNKKKCFLFKKFFKKFKFSITSKSDMNFLKNNHIEITL
jgi:hypothetical protein